MVESPDEALTGHCFEITSVQHFRGNGKVWVTLVWTGSDELTLQKHPCGIPTYKYMIFLNSINCPVIKQTFDPIYFNTWGRKAGVRTRSNKIRARSEIGSIAALDLIVKGNQIVRLLASQYLLGPLRGVMGWNQTGCNLMNMKYLLLVFFTPSWSSITPFKSKFIMYVISCFQVEKTIIFFHLQMPQL